jgi:CheY-like chemotaxis protein
MTRILVIDDDQSVRIAIQTLLLDQDCVAILAVDGGAGIRTFESGFFDLVMVDIFMPGIDGLEVIKRFRESAPRVPIIAMSGFRFRGACVAPVPDFLGMAAKFGATYCLQKPFGPQQLMAAVNGCLGQPLRRAAQA